jgi:hypothetical protein
MNHKSLEGVKGKLHVMCSYVKILSDDVESMTEVSDFVQGEPRKARLYCL